MPVKNKGNPVSDQSKQWMEDSLLQLMRTEKFTEITIQEITDHANLSRRTFYRNFESKEDILKGRFSKIWSEYEQNLRRMENRSASRVGLMFFSVMQEHFDFLALVNRQNLLPLFLAEVDELFPDLFHDIKGSRLPYSAESIQYALAFSTGGFMRILTKWLNDRPLKSPQEMSGIVEDIIKIATYPVFQRQRPPI